MEVVLLNRFNHLIFFPNNKKNPDKFQVHKSGYIKMATSFCAVLYKLYVNYWSSKQIPRMSLHMKREAVKGMCTEVGQIVCKSGISMWYQTHVLSPQAGKSHRNSWLRSNSLKQKWWEALEEIGFVIVEISSQTQWVPLLNHALSLQSCWSKDKDMKMLYNSVTFFSICTFTESSQFSSYMLIVEGGNVNY